MQDGTGEGQIREECGSIETEKRQRDNKRERTKGE